MANGLEGSKVARIDEHPDYRHVGGDMSALHDSWKDGFYTPGKGEIVVGGTAYKFCVQELEAGPGEVDFPTTKRMILKVAQDFGARHDIVITMFFGWGEVSAQFDGDFLDTLLKSLKLKGYRNPKIIGINCAGKGAEEYVTEPGRSKISGLGIDDEISDAASLTTKLQSEGEFDGDEIVIIAHSVGVFNAFECLRVLKEIEENIREIGGKTHINVSRVVSLMPVTDKPLGMTRMSFIVPGLPYLAPAIVQSILGKGSLAMTQRDYDRTMISGMEEDGLVSGYSRGVPDSAKRYLQLVNNMTRKFAHPLPVRMVRGTNFDVVRGGRDVLIPPSAISDWADRTVRARTTSHELKSFPHSFPFRFSQDMREELSDLFGQLFSRH